tara:strand:- start:59 stop:775 length:717 start_codon:yes stop_codon:yes gene_type:complete
MAIDTLGANALASNSVTTAKIAADAVTSAKIPAGAVVVGDIADGSITTDKLAADAVTAAKLADNAVVTANFASGAITGSVMPTGTVIQTVSGRTDTRVTGNGISMDIISAAITPTSTSSKILIYGSLSAMSDVNHVGIRLYRNGAHIADAPEVQSGTTFNMQQLISASFDNNNHGNNNNASYGTNAVLFYDSPSSTSALTYLFKLHQPSTSGTNLFVNGGPNTYQSSTSNIILQEIVG